MKLEPLLHSTQHATPGETGREKTQMVECGAHRREKQWVRRLNDIERWRLHAAQGVNHEANHDETVGRPIAKQGRIRWPHLAREHVRQLIGEGSFDRLVAAGNHRLWRSYGCNCLSAGDAVACEVLRNGRRCLERRERECRRNFVRCFENLKALLHAWRRLTRWRRCRMKNADVDHGDALGENGGRIWLCSERSPDRDSERGRVYRGADQQACAPRGRLAPRDCVKTPHFGWFVPRQTTTFSVRGCR